MKRVKRLTFKKQKHFSHLQIQAYERVILFLERIDPNNMIIRTHKNGMNAITLHRELLKIVREEYTHNMSQQIYIQPKSWKTVLNAKDETIQILNVAVNNLSADSSGLDLSAKIFESIASKKLAQRKMQEIQLLRNFNQQLNKQNLFFSGQG